MPAENNTENSNVVDIPPTTDESENEIISGGENDVASNNIINDSSNTISSENQIVIDTPNNTVQ